MANQYDFYFLGCTGATIINTKRGEFAKMSKSSKFILTRIKN
jgi:hypothetical protein